MATAMGIISVTINGVTYHKGKIMNEETRIQNQILEEQGRHHDTVFYSWLEFELFVRLMWRGTFKEIEKGGWRDNPYTAATDEVLKHLNLKDRIEIHLDTKRRPVDVSKVVAVVPATLEPAQWRGGLTRSKWNKRVHEGGAPATYRLPWGQVKPKQEWVDEESGYACFMRLDPTLKVLCAYVLLPPDHPWAHDRWDHGIINLGVIQREIGREITFTGTLADNDEHNMKAYPGLFAVGFDGAQTGDLVPNALIGSHGEFAKLTWRDEGYMREALKKLAKLAKRAALRELTTTLNEKFQGLYPKAVDGNDVELDAEGTTMLIRAVAASTIAEIVRAVFAGDPDFNRRQIYSQLQDRAVHSSRYYAKQFKDHGERLTREKRGK